MSDQKGDDSLDSNNSEIESSDEELSSTEDNDSKQNSPENPRVGQSNSVNKADDEDSSDSSLLPDENGNDESQELSSGGSLPENNSEDIESSKSVHEYPGDSKQSEVSQLPQHNQKRSHDDKSVQFFKKPKNYEPNNMDNTNQVKENTKTNEQVSTSGISEEQCSNEDFLYTQNDNIQNCSSRQRSLNLHRRTAKPFRRLFKENPNKNPNIIETRNETNEINSNLARSASISEGAFADIEDNVDSQSNESIDEMHAVKKIKMTTSTSEGALADVEDNIDSQSNDDVSDDDEINHPRPISNNEDTKVSKLVLDQRNTSNPMLVVTKEPDLQNQTKIDDSTSRVVSESSNRSPQGHSQIGVASTPSEASNELKLKSNTEKSKKRKCLVCNKKLDLTAFPCRCGGIYCPLHRYDNEHNCSFDYKTLGEEEIRKNNPRVIAEKVSKL